MNADLHFEFDGSRGATVYRTLRQDPPWKVVRGFSLATGACLVHLNNVSGGIFGGDSLHLIGRLRPGAEAQLTTTGATRLYTPRVQPVETSPDSDNDSSLDPIRDSVLDSQFHLGENSLLEYLPDLLIPYRDVRARQRTAFTLAQGAALFAWDTVAPGRVASGESFAYRRLALTLEVTVAGLPILNDRLLLEPRRWAISSAGRLGPETGYLVTFLAVRAGAPVLHLRALESSLSELLAGHAAPGDFWGASILPAHGVLVRGLATSSLHLPGLLYKLWSHAKQELLDRPATAPRKTY